MAITVHRLQESLPLSISRADFWQVSRICIKRTLDLKILRNNREKHVLEGVKHGFSMFPKHIESIFLARAKHITTTLRSGMLKDGKQLQGHQRCFLGRRENQGKLTFYFVWFIEPGSYTIRIITSKLDLTLRHVTNRKGGRVPAYDQADRELESALELDFFNKRTELGNGAET